MSEQIPDNSEKTKAHILIATDCFLPRWDGIARFLDEILPSLCEQFQVTVIAPDFKGEYKHSYDAHIIRIPLQKMSFGDYSPAKYESRVIDEQVQKADLVWTHTTVSIATAAIKAAHKYKKPHFAYIHSIDWQLVRRAAGKSILGRVLQSFTHRHVKKLLAQANMLMVPSQEVIEIMRWHGIKAPCRVIPLGIKTDEFTPSESRSEAKKNIGLDPRSPVIGYVGRISHEKDLPTLFSAIEKVKEEFSNVTTLIVGDGLKEIKHKYSEWHNVHFVGSQSNVVPYLQAMDMYVLPSLLETTSLSTLEAMSCEVPVIATKVGSVKHYIKEKENGLLFPQKNHYVLAIKIKWILQHTQKAKQMAKEGRLTVIEDHNWDQTVKKIADIFESLS